MSDARITVITATTLAPDRLATLERAMATVLGQETPETGRIIPLLVVNGDRFDADALAAWRARDDVRVEYLPRGSLPGALIHGRGCVDTEFFSFLDDDDEYLPGTLAARAAVLDADPELDVAVSNGIMSRPDGETLATQRYDLHDRDALIGLATENWLLSAAGLFRRSTVDADFWSETDQYLEWTAVAFRLALRRRVRLLREPGFRIHDTPGSLSKSSGFIRTRYQVLAELLTEHREEMPKAAWRVWSAKLGDELHCLAEILYGNGEWRAAWGYHLRSLARIGGARFLAFSRHLLWPPGRNR